MASSTLCDADAASVMVDVVIPAAGSSQRMNLPTAKQFLKVMGKHILAYTVDGFHRLACVRHIVVVASPDQVDVTTAIIDSYGFTKVLVCSGSHTRHRSIQCGIKALRQNCSSSDVVVIHDGARPFVPKDILMKVSQEAKNHGAAGVTRPLVSTVIRGDHQQNLAESLDRRLYQNSEMPQAFQYDIIAQAYQKCTEEDLDHGTECLLLALKYVGCHAKLVEGNDRLWKVTYQKDVYSMESTIKEQQTMISINWSSPSSNIVESQLLMKLQQRNLKVVEKNEPANTFVMFVNPGLEETLILEMCSYIDKTYTSLPFSAVKLDPYVILVSANTFVKDLEYCDNERENNIKQSDQSSCGLPAFFKKNIKGEAKKGVTVLQVIYDTNENLARVLDDLIWQRGAYLDEQTLSIS